MMAQGTDGVSRGSLRDVVAVGQDMLDLWPWEKSAIELDLKLNLWMESWLPNYTVFLRPEEWFTCGHDIVGGKVDKRGF